MGLKDKLAAKKPASKPVDSDGDDIATTVANLQRELAESRAKLGEIEKERDTLRTRAEQSEGKYTAEKIRGALRNAAVKANAVDADDIVKFVINDGARLDGDKVVFGQGADAKDADAFISELLAAKPHLQRAAQVAQGSGTPARSADQPPAAPLSPKKLAPGATPAEARAYYDAERDALLARAEAAQQRKQARQ